MDWPAQTCLRWRQTAQAQIASQATVNATARVLSLSTLLDYLKSFALRQGTVAGNFKTSDREGLGQRRASRKMPGSAGQPQPKQHENLSVLLGVN